MFKAHGVSRSDSRLAQGSTRTCGERFLGVAISLFDVEQIYELHLGNLAHVFLASSSGLLCRPHLNWIFYRDMPAAGSGC